MKVSWQSAVSLFFFFLCLSVSVSQFDLFNGAGEAYLSVVKVWLTYNNLLFL